MHHAQRYAELQWPEKFAGHLVSANDATSLRACLEKDALNYLYSAWVSFADAIGGLRAGLSSWATVKLYYAAFYAARARLAVDGYGVLYQKEKPVGCHAKIGVEVSKLKGTTHKVVFDVCGQRYPSHPLYSGVIGMEPASRWLMERREHANYKAGRFGEPETPGHFERALAVGLRRTLAAYANDSMWLYALDPDHAMIAFPLAALIDVQKTFLVASKERLDSPAAEFLRASLKDESGPLPSLLTLVAKIASA